MALALLGEALILLGFVMLATATPGGNPLIRDAVATLPYSPLVGPTVILLMLGFGLKMGFDSPACVDASCTSCGADTCLGGC